MKHKIKDKSAARKKYLRFKTVQDKEEYKKRRIEAKLAVREPKQKSWENVGRDINKYYEIDNRKFWSTIKSLNGNKKKTMRAIRDSNGKLATKTKEVLETWTDTTLAV